MGAGCFTNASVFKLRKSEPELPRPYRAWGYIYYNNADVDYFDLHL
jgi:hypothetical protein